MHPQILFTHSSCKWTTKTCFAPPFITKLHPSYHLNPSQPDYAMCQSSLFISDQPYADMCHYPCKHIWTNQGVPRHHLPPSHTWNPNPNFPPLLPSPWQPLATIHGPRRQPRHHHRSASESSRQPSRIWTSPTTTAPCRSCTIHGPRAVVSGTSIFSPHLQCPRHGSRIQQLYSP